jgi:hypothetical protein
MGGVLNIRVLQDIIHLVGQKIMVKKMSLGLLGYGDLLGYRHQGLDSQKGWPAGP